ncbi:GNAT family N-acetyltransferase [Biostraticola tofi]|nr:GNAT family N-acetyltransferase [Biostraticola tofi]
MKIELLSAATLPAYRGSLAALLIDAVSHGASVGYKSILSQEEAESYFHSLRPDIAKNNLLLWIAHDHHGLAGSIQLELCQKPDGRNRAEIQKLLVHSRNRRKGVGKELLKVLERTSLAQRRGILHLDTEAGSAAESFYRAQGYRCLGEIPDYACSPDGIYRPTVIYYKRLFAVNQHVGSIAN